MTSVEVEDALLTTKQVAACLAVSPYTLQAWRLRGGGPRSVKIGRSVRYSMADLAAYIAENKVQRTQRRRLTIDGRNYLQTWLAQRL